MRLRVPDSAACEEHFPLVWPEAHAQAQVYSARHVSRCRFASASDRREDVRDSETVALLDSIIVLRVRKGHRRDPRIHEVVQVDPGETLREDELDAEEHRGDGGVLAGGALTVVVPCYAESAARLPRPRWEDRIHVLDDVFGEGRDVRTEREDFRARRHDVVRRDVVTESD